MIMGPHTGCQSRARRRTPVVRRVARGIRVRVRVWARSTSLLLFQATRFALLVARFSTTVYGPGGDPPRNVLPVDPTGAFNK
jgi:hypothetical protein